jgi:PKD repeat protein
MKKDEKDARRLGVCRQPYHRGRLMTIKDKDAVIPYRAPPDGGEAMSNLGHRKPGLFQRSLTISLVALLTILPAAAFAGPADGDATATPAVGALSVDTDPPGAAVYVDGRFAGQTPLHVTTLATGDHRVRVVKDGFLENGRTVSITAKQASTVQVRLTRTTATNTDAASQATGATGGGGGGGAKKWIIIGAAAGGGAAVLVLLSKRSKPPEVGSITANPTQGLAASTSISFSVQASDPNGKSLSYNWNFGDGSNGSGATPTHTYASAGTFTVSVAVSNDKESVTSPTASVTIRSMAGAWTGTFGSFNFTMNLTQNGTTIGGSYTDSDGPGAVSGVVSAGNSVRITVTQGAFLPFTFTGTADAAVANVSGNVTGLVSAATFTMRR